MNSINQIYKSRKTILELLSEQGYDVDSYIDFSINEIDAMSNNSQLDMLLEDKDKSKKVYVKYSLQTKQIRWQQNLEEIIEDLYYIENVLTTKDDLVIIINEEPNENLLNKLKYIYDNDGIFIVMHNISRLQFNIINHVLVPKCNILTEKEAENFKIEYKIKNNKQLPQMSRFDPQALALCVRPGQICNFSRKSINAITAPYYRICV
tara:strand:- start:291 stop:911 length:621 start_codon:yes stop_codon:yes gene_type:complete